MTEREKETLTEEVHAEAEAQEEVQQEAADAELDAEGAAEETEEQNAEKLAGELADLNQRFCGWQQILKIISAAQRRKKTICSNTAMPS